MLSKQTLTFVDVTNFAISQEEAFISDCTPPRILPLAQARAIKRIPDVQEIRADFFHRHYENAFHDFTLLALESAIPPEESLAKRLQGVQVVSDRRTLRRLMMNKCVPLPSHTFYCKKENLSLMAEKHNGTLFLGMRTRFEEHPGGHGMGFEQIMTESTRSQPESSYRLIEVKLDESMNVLLRHEVDAVDDRDRCVEFKSRKHNPRYPPGTDFFLNIWIQMALSNMSTVRIGEHSNGQLVSVKDYSLAEIQTLAGLSSAIVQRGFASLAQVLKDISSRVEEGCQAAVDCSDRGIITVDPCDDFSLPLMSSFMRLKLLSPRTPEALSPVSPALEKETTEDLTTVFNKLEITGEEGK